MSKHNIIAEQLYYIVNQKLGFDFDFKVCNVPDFYQFLIHYCHQSINLQFINGVFVAFTKNMNFMSYYSNFPNYQNYKMPYCNQNNFNSNWNQQFGYYQSYNYNNQGQNYQFLPNNNQQYFSNSCNSTSNENCFSNMAFYK